MNNAWENELIIGILFLAAGIIFGIVCYYNYSIYSANATMFAGLTGALSFNGIYAIGKCIYWSRPQNRDAYNEQRRKQENFDKDERIRAIRHCMGYIMYLLTLLVLAIMLITTIFIEVDQSLMLVLIVFFFFELIGGALLLPFLDKRM